MLQWILSGRTDFHDYLADRTSALLELLPATEVFDIFVTIIFGNKTIEFTSIQKYGQLREYVLEIIHKQVFIAKVQNQDHLP